MSNANPKLIAYVRVSTAKQGESGLGLEAQQAALDLYAAANGGTFVQAYREVESGTDDSRPALAKAVAHAKRIKGRLVIAKLDRLARSVHTISGIMQSGVDFVACDNPHANRLTIHILAAVAEDEAVRISQRTKAALTAAKARGKLLGSARPGHWDGHENARLKGAHRGGAAARAKWARETVETYAAVLGTVRELREAGESLQVIADRLNADGHTTAKGAAWGPVQVSRLLAKVTAAA